MKVLLASSEIHPYSKTGGLADMAGALGKYLAHAGTQVALVTPLYTGIRERFPALEKMPVSLHLPLGRRLVSAEVWRLNPEANLAVYFVDQPDFYYRPALYQESGIDYADNGERFIFFSKAVAQVAEEIVKPDLVHSHDWQAGLVPLLIAHQKSLGNWAQPTQTCLTIHNLAYQGNFPVWTYELTNLPWDYFTPDGVEFYGGFNCLKAGIVYADRIATVSPRYAREITTPELGCGLDGLLRARQSALIGILNGVDYEEWKTTDNPFLRFSYTAASLEKKTEEKYALQQELGLFRTDTPLFATITRLVDQKGIDILLGALRQMLAADIQFALLGSGAPAFERAFHELARQFPGKTAVTIGQNQGLAHRIEAGADFYLMPSKFEPCGLNQMYSLRYGTIPIVRATGGLDDSIIDATENIDSATGVKFSDYSEAALAKAMQKALAIYASPDLFRHYRLNGLETDFSWNRTASAYRDVYRQAKPSNE